MARALTCQCGYTITGADDEELARLGRQHIDQVHPEMKLTDEQVRGLVRQLARDA
jgi:predicted small metal-binding protein